MKIIRFNLHNLRNNEFFQYMTRVRELVDAATPAALKIEAVYAEFTAAYGRLDEAFMKINKSILTARINEADHSRDTVFRGLADMVNAALRHFDPQAREAAEKLAIVFHTYGNVNELSHDEETSALYNLISELRGNCQPEIDDFGLEPWINELERLNKNVETIMMDRFDETASQTSLVMRECRLATGEVYHRLADRIDALAILAAEFDTYSENNGSGNGGGGNYYPPGTPAGNSIWDVFIAELNQIIEHTESIVAIRRGKAAVKKEEEKAKEEAARKAQEAAKKK